ncbi:pH-response regulator protein palF/RIM8 [Plectosphaerella plurivora]|uniref:PH-response regulator protein palF/RIM8 n=1 Tax=Plectosphaerella plurivora TaxID=936078 RepID=A0A9P8V9Y9_9PEZI|nr:pH-response regulator protein palF/RIM8 [Plectosphaerella plurivora]
MVDVARSAFPSPPPSADPQPRQCLPIVAYMGAYFNSNGASVDQQNPSRSFFSRFSLPMRGSRTRHIADFHISPKEPHRQYNAGDHVHGAVNLTVLKPIRITHLTVTLHGYVRVSKGPAVAERELTTPVLNGRPDAQYHGNGYASLFQDEVVLAGDGKLDSAKYQFEFDLQLPKTALPSSIDFERGTISYMITATLTRPTPMSPTTSCDRKISLVEKIDVGTLAPPRPQTIYLEPISKRRKRKQTTPIPERPHTTTDVADRASVCDSTVDQSVTSDEAPHDLHESPRSPTQPDVRSEISDDSGLTTSSNMSDRGTEFRELRVAQTQAKLQAVDEKTITATIELLKGGAVAGDMATIKVSVQHIKKLKSMHGVIVTLYRQGRIDTAPPASSFGGNLSRDGQAQREELYPRSRTGLGGLSLSSATSLSVFRKDLSQTIAPLIVYPPTLETTVTASVKVPEDAFPTIKNVPGEMVSFKYHIEVVVDLGGRLANHLSGGTQSNSATSETANYMSRGTNVIDTDRLRREKGVISVNFELVMGTEDSMRGRARANTMRTYQMHEHAMNPEEVISPYAESTIERTDGGHGYWPQSAVPRSVREPSLTRQLTNGTTRPSHSPEEDAPAYVPPPQITDEVHLSEKERIRRHEQRLLPSQPPQDPSAGSSSSAPPFVPESDIYNGDDDVPAPSAPTLNGSVHQGTIVAAHDEHAPSVPTLDDLASPNGQVEDKQELERQRLLLEASAPPEFPEDCEAGPSAASAPPPTELEPSAPALGEEDAYGNNYSYRQEASGPSTRRDVLPGHEPLPAYER